MMAKKKVADMAVEPVLTAEQIDVAVKKVVSPTFKVMNPDRTSTELLETRAFSQYGVTNDVNHTETLAKLEIWTDQPRFYIKRLPAGCFFNPWDYKKGSKDDIRYQDVYGRKAKWVEVKPQVFQLYERFILGEDFEGKKIHNNLLLVQADQMYRNSQD